MAIKSALEFIRGIEVSDEIASEDRMLRHPKAAHNYFYTGRANIFVVLNVLNLRLGYMEREEPIRTLLDFGSGYGRITRWFRAAFPGAAIYVTDRDAAAAQWCAAHFDCTAIDTELAESQFDLVWAGSVFTHLPEHIAAPLLDRLLRSLRPNGVLALTTHGRARIAKMADYDWQRDPQRPMHFNLGKSRYEQIVAGYRATGYGYVDYPHMADYGICVASAGWYAAQVMKQEAFIQILAQERADNRQDVVAFMRLGVGSEAWGPLWRDCFAREPPAPVVDLVSSVG